MSVVNNGWDDIVGYRQVNFINSNWFGLIVFKWGNGNLESIGLHINDKRFGWFDDYDFEGVLIDSDWTGFFLNGDKI